MRTFILFQYCGMPNDDEKVIFSSSPYKTLLSTLPPHPSPLRDFKLKKNTTTTITWNQCCFDLIYSSFTNFFLQLHNFTSVFIAAYELLLLSYDVRLFFPFYSVLNYFPVLLCYVAHFLRGFVRKNQTKMENSGKNVKTQNRSNSGY